MGFKIEGWDDIESFLNEYRKGLDPQTFDDWARRVAETAKTMCDDCLQAYQTAPAASAGFGKS